MTAYAALLRAVNVGGVGRLPMAVLADICEAAGFTRVKTFIASGNVVFRSNDDEDGVRSAIESRLKTHAGRPVGVLVRTAEELAGVVARNPFADHPARSTVALFVDGPLASDALEKATGVGGEQFRLGLREIFIAYGDGMGASRLRIPAAKAGTARNINTVTTLARMTAGLALD